MQLSANLSQDYGDYLYVKCQIVQSQSSRSSSVFRTFKNNFNTFEIINPAYTENVIVNLESCPTVNLRMDPFLSLDFNLAVQLLANFIYRLFGDGHLLVSMLLRTT